MAKRLTDAATFWDARAETWRRLADEPASFYTQRTIAVCDLLSRYLDRGAVIDIGCGPGLLVCELYRRGFEACGADISREMVDRAVQRAAAELPDPTYRFAVCGESTIPFAGPFDAITAIGVLPYIGNYAAYLMFMSAHLAPGGLLIASSTNRFSLFTIQELMRHLANLGRTPQWAAIASNLVRTGVWSGGNVESSVRRQRYTAASFDALCRLQGFAPIDSLDLYNIDALDRFPLHRGTMGRWFARHLAWTHIGVYRKR